MNRIAFRNLVAPAVVVLLLAAIAPGMAQDATKLHVIKKLELGGDGGWDDLTCDSAAKRLYVSRSNRVMVVDLQTGKLAGEIANTPGVHAIALAPRLRQGFTSNGGDNTVTVFDTGTLKELARVIVGTRPDAILYDRASNRVFTFNAGSSDATAVDAATHQVAGTIPLGGKPEFAVSDGQGTVYVNIEDKSEIVAIDPRALTVKARWSLAPGEEPTGLAIDRRTQRLFAVCGNEKMVVVDAASGKVVATPAIGKGPDGCVVDAQAGYAFSSNGQDGTLTVVKEEAPDRYSVVATIPTQRGARTMALDARTHTIYLPTARFQPQPPAEPGAPRRRPAIEPGSFVILVLGE